MCPDALFFKPGVLFFKRGRRKREAEKEMCLIPFPSMGQLGPGEVLEETEVAALL